MPTPSVRIVVATLSLLAACAKPSAKPKDNAFAGLQSRGESAMGVNQYTSSHAFEALPDGGRIVLQRDAVDAVATAQIRAHMQDIATRFAGGDFAIPGFVHAQTVPGTAVMAARKATITYTPDTLPRGGQVRIFTSDSAAVAAVHEFLAFQRMDHRVGDHSQHMAKP